MNFNFELILFYATLISGLIAIADILYFAPRRQRWGAKKVPVVIDYARSFFPVLLVVFLFRSFFYEPFRIPSGSLEPTLMTGDFILVNKFDYGVRLPVIHQKIAGKGEPKRGDIVVFRWPPNPSYDFVKRIIGLPGDHISYINKELIINGQQIPQNFIKDTIAYDEEGDEVKVQLKEEDLMGIKHKIFINPARPIEDYKDIVVPEGMYFMMGDNRDDSADSRYWGFVADKDVVGKAVLVWMSWDSVHTNIRGDRVGSWVH